MVRRIDTAMLRITVEHAERVTIGVEGRLQGHGCKSWRAAGARSPPFGIRLP
jgi:hypothetical protein